MIVRDAERDQRTIPDDILDRIVARWPDLRAMVDGLRANPTMAGRHELDIVNNIPTATVFPTFTPSEWLALCKCSVGEPYGLPDEWLTMPEAAERLDDDPTTIYRALASQGIPTVERGQKRWVRAADVARAEKRRPGRPRKPASCCHRLPLVQSDRLPASPRRDDAAGSVGP